MVFNRFLVAFVLISATTHLHSCELSTTSTTSIRRVSFSDAQSNLAASSEQASDKRQRAVSDSDVPAMSEKRKQLVKDLENLWNL